MASNQLLDSLHLRGFLSFGPWSEPVALQGLNVLIGPNGSGKSNFIEAIELLHAAPTDFAAAIRIGGMPSDWIWHGTPGVFTAQIDAVTAGVMPNLHYGIEFIESGERLGIIDEVLKNTSGSVHYCRAEIIPLMRTPESLATNQSILSHIRDYDNHPEITVTGNCFKNIQLFREWTFGRSSPLRIPQSANLPPDALLPNPINLGLVLNNLEHHPKWNPKRFNELMSRFLPRFTRLSTRILGGAVLVYLHEDGFGDPIPATRLSDGTLRILTLLTILLNPDPAPLICIEEPEVGLHPDVMDILAELLVEASSKTQLIVTTHSDSLVSALTSHAESVLVCEYGRNGTELRRVDSEKLQFWLDKYLLGDIWQMGELGGNP